MADHKYYLKDKKLSVWEFTTTSSYGVTKKTYVKKYSRIWCYYRHSGGSANLRNSNGTLVYDDNAKAIFVINRREISADWVIVYNHKIYEIKQIDDFEGYADDIKIIAELANNQNFSAYSGLSDD